ncbi:hypothetical protein M378DRAFT_174428 [Amanita muscaria Koide BX008]|uniref:Uncharacterized protein n=1 Tax=Amanita muscaria (strain Koide BX008) TaxID=946122 RepID=A0A0C2VZ73_AMAMK|nr:hypothetical protein M378DRAFT_174428 [Amanita muscaria Koide BX008]
MYYGGSSVIGKRGKCVVHCRNSDEACKRYEYDGKRCLDGSNNSLITVQYIVGVIVTSST